MQFPGCFQVSAVRVALVFNALCLRLRASRRREQKHSEISTQQSAKGGPEARFFVLTKANKKRYNPRG